MVTEIKKMADDFLRAEADALDKWFTSKDIKVVNEAYEKMHSYTVDVLRGQMGQILLTQPKSDSFYDGSENLTPSLPRHLYKISHYKHAKYKDVWVVYTSPKNPHADFKTLTNAFFVINENGTYKIASHIGYTDLDPDLQMRVEKSKWVWLGGLADLDFDSLGELVEIDRYQEPLDFEDNLTMYLEDK